MEFDDRCHLLLRRFGGRCCLFLLAESPQRLALLVGAAVVQLLLATSGT
jgi:hypothetical protein